MYTKFILPLSLVFLFVACNNDKTIEANGAKIVIKEDVEGKNAVPGDSIFYHLKLYNRTKMEQGVLKIPLTDTYAAGRLMKQLVIKPVFQGGIQESYPYLSKGDSAIVTIDGGAVYSNQKLPWKHQMIENGDQLEYYIKVVDIKKKSKK